jgi:hypothetical protein
MLKTTGPIRPNVRGRQYLSRETVFDVITRFFEEPGLGARLQAANLLLLRSANRRPQRAASTTGIFASEDQVQMKDSRRGRLSL